MHRIFFDSDLGTQKYGYWLVFEQSRHDLSLLGSELREGLRVIIYMPEELEMEAVPEFDATDNKWIGVPVPGKTTYLDGST